MKLRLQIMYLIINYFYSMVITMQLHIGCSVLAMLKYKLQTIEGNQDDHHIM